jgi:GNAT superfamily N-acetyltransferase
LEGKMTVETNPATRGEWRPMRAEDLPEIRRISYAVHGAYGEEEAVYAERLALYPQGCFTFERAGEIIGFIVTHPWHRGASPALNAYLGTVPNENADYYLHDIALLPETRGQGFGEAALKRVVDHAREQGFANVSLVAVNGAESYWASRGFLMADDGAEGTTYGPGTYRMRLPIG